MRTRGFRAMLLAGTGLGFVLAGPAFAQQQPECTQRLDDVEQRISQAELQEGRQSDIQEVIRGARTLADAGDQQGCMNVVAELEELAQTVEQGGQQGAAQQQAQTGQPPAGQAAMPDTEQPTATAKEQLEDSAGAGQEQGQQTEQAQTGGQQQPGTQEQMAAEKPQEEQAQQQAQTGQQQGQQAQTGQQQEGQQAEGKAQVEAQIAIQQPVPRITVRQQPPTITVNVPPPIVTIQMPEPEVQVQMADPEIQVEMGQPQVRVQDTQAQASMQGQQQVQPEVTIEQAEPQVEVTQAEPEVRIERVQAGGQQGQPMAAAAGGQQGGQQQQMAAEEQQEEQAQQQGQQQAQTGQQQGGQQQQMAAEEQQEEQAQQQAQTGQPQTGQQQGGQQQQAAGGQPTAEEHPLTAMPASEVIGTEVMNPEGDQVAEIVDLVKEQGQNEVMAVLSVGGFLGVGDKKVVVPLEDLDVAPDNQIIAAGMTEDDVKAMPAYDEARYESTLEQIPASAPAGQQQ